MLQTWWIVDSQEGQAVWSPRQRCRGMGVGVDGKGGEGREKFLKSLQDFFLEGCESSSPSSIPGTLGPASSDS